MPLNMEQKQINIAIKKIKEVEFIVNEELELSNPPAANITFELTTNFNLKEKSVELLLSASFEDSEQGSVFMKIRTSNVFLLNELAEFQNPDGDSFNIPDNVMVTLFSLSVSHTRALMAKNALGTKFAEMYLPIINPSLVLKGLFNR